MQESAKKLLWKSIEEWLLLSKGRHELTQLDVELSCVSEVSIATQLNSTQLNLTDLLCADWLYAATGSVALPIAGDS